MNTYLKEYKKFMKIDIKGYSKLPYKKWPNEWKDIYFKGYPRFKKFPLDRNIWDKNQNELVNLLRHRRSKNFFPVEKNMTKGLLSYILLGAAVTKVGKSVYSDSYRSYPSAGRRYPLEVYIFLRRSKELHSGIYHYHVRTHSLEFLWNLKDQDIYNSFKQHFVKKSSLIIIITACINRSKIKYGEIAYHFMNLEAGHMMQNFILLLETKKRGYRNIGRFDAKKITALLDIRLEEEIPLYAISIN